MPAPRHAKTRKIFDCLKGYAAEKRIDTYGEVGEKVELFARAVSNPHLYRIRDECIRRGWPRLDGLVVRKRNRLPGEGFNYGVLITKEEHNAIVREVFDFDWSTANFPTS